MSGDETPQRRAAAPGSRRAIGPAAKRDPTPDLTAGELALWRRETRERLIASRLATPPADRYEAARRIAVTLDRMVRPEPGLAIGLYWPFRGEPDLRDWMRTAEAAGARVALPVVVARGRPLVFRQWRPGCDMARGVWGIPTPAEGPEIAPDVVIAPLVGFDASCYRLGYGGGFYDRTLAALEVRPMAIGVGFEAAALPTIHPQPHDIPMDAIVTGPEARFRAETG